MKQTAPAIRLFLVVGLMPLALLAGTYPVSTQATSAAMGSRFSYSFLEGGYIAIDRGRVDDSGLQIGGSAGLARNFSLFGGYADTGDIEQLSVGGLFHTPVSADVDLVMGASLEDLEVGRVDDTGFGIRAGLRWQAPHGRVELSPEIRHLDVFSDTATSLRLGALFPVAPRLKVQGALQGGDDDRFEAGVRYEF